MSGGLYEACLGYVLAQAIPFSVSSRFKENDELATVLTMKYLSTASSYAVVWLTDTSLVSADHAMMKRAGFTSVCRLSHFTKGKDDVGYIFNTVSGCV